MDKKVLSLPDALTLTEPTGSNFCYYPFMQILLTSDGKYRPCSKHQDYITHEDRELNAAEGDTLEDAWNSDYMKDIREHFLENKKFEGCRECWRMQDMGLRSMRFDSYQYQTPVEQVESPIQPTRIEINASNICNLRCRICYPNASTKWIKEHSDLYGSSEKTYRNMELPNLSKVKEWAGSLEEVCFFGGEPLLSEENLGLLDYFVSNGYAAKISLLFNTNGTVFNDEIIGRLRHFKRVRMYFSIDDMGKRFEYQRSGAQWNAVKANIDRAYTLSRSKSGNNIDFKICCTVSIFNIYYFPEFFEWFGTNYPGLRIFWNLLFDPWRLNVQILPTEVKKEITERLQNHVKATYAMSEPETKTIDELVTFLNDDMDKPFEEFFRYVNRHDTYRKESFSATFPEFWSVIRPYAPDYFNPGVYDYFDRIQWALEEWRSNQDSKIFDGLRTVLENEHQYDGKTPNPWLLVKQQIKFLRDHPRALLLLYAALSGTSGNETKRELIDHLFSDLKFNSEKGRKIEPLLRGWLETELKDDLLLSLLLQEPGKLRSQLLVTESKVDFQQPQQVAAWLSDTLRIVIEFERVVPLYAVVRGTANEEAKAHLINQLFLRLETEAERHEVKTILKECFDHETSNELLISMLITNPVTLTIELKKHNGFELLETIEREHGTMHGLAKDVIRGDKPIEVFGRIAELLRMSKEEETNAYRFFDMCRDFFRDTDLVWPLFKSVVLSGTKEDTLNEVCAYLTARLLTKDATRNDLSSAVKREVELRSEHDGDLNDLLQKTDKELTQLISQAISE